MFEFFFIKTFYNFLTKHEETKTNKHSFTYILIQNLKRQNNHALMIIILK